MNIHRTFRRTLILVLAVIVPLHAQAQTASDSHIRNVALRVLELDVRRQLPSAAPATIDSLLALYTDSVVYEHPSVGAVVRGKAALRAGMLKYLGSVRVAQIETPRLVIGPGVVVVEATARPDPRDPSRVIPPSRRAVRVLEFDARGLVRRILDYPW
ncbi:MAG: nuclear transport factor 2 family protein [Cytophagaceae bacterium]|nr:nuclear transport factor 2 family protein [Gemmatimonadaceae bacterium]